MFSKGEKRLEKLFLIASVVFLFLSFLASLPHILQDAMCAQMTTPYRFGAIFVHSGFNNDNTETVVFLNTSFTAIVTLGILGLNISMVWKLRSLRKSPSAQSTSAQISRAERSLTGTMFVLLIPLVLYSFMAMVQLLSIELLPYIQLVGDTLGDVQVHLASCYFYFTHPVFKKQGKTQNSRKPLHATQKYIERTLTGTMIVLMIPVLIYVCASLIGLFASSLVYYAQMVSSLTGDVCVHMATCYFYFTNPIFKNTVKVDATKKASIST